MQPPDDAPEVQFGDLFNTVKDNSFIRVCIHKPEKPDEEPRVYAQHGSLDKLIEWMKNEETMKSFSGLASQIARPGLAYFSAVLEHTFFKPLSDMEPYFLQFYIKWQNEHWAYLLIPKVLERFYWMSAHVSNLEISRSQPVSLIIGPDLEPRHVEFPIPCMSLIATDDDSPYHTEMQEQINLLCQGTVDVSEAIRMIMKSQRDMFNNEIDKINTLGDKLGFPKVDPKIRF